MDPVTICNMAMGWLGAKKIRTIDVDDADSVEEELCSVQFPMVVRSTLEARAWLFATGSVDLGAASDSGDLEFPSQFVLPTTVIRALACDDGSGTWDMQWERRGQTIVTEATTVCKVRAVIYSEDVKKWTPTFCRAVAARLAADCAGPLTEGTVSSEKLEAKYLRELQQAGVFDGQQGSSRQMRNPYSAALRR